jgi:hypothetical protein
MTLNACTFTFVHLTLDKLATNSTGPLGEAV